MPRVIIAADAQTVVNDVRAVLDDGQTDIVEVDNGADVRTEVEAEDTDLVIADFQVGSMGAMAICLDLRLEESGGRLPYVPVLMLCDRRADVFLAKRSSADGYLVKPLDPIRLRKAIAALLDERTYFDDSYRPVPTLVSAPGATAPAVSPAEPAPEPASEPAAAEVPAGEGDAAAAASAAQES